MKIAIFLPSGNLGGAEQVLLQIANYYAKQNAHVYVYLMTNLGAEDFSARLEPNVNLININAGRELVGSIRLLMHFIGKHKRNKGFDYAFTSHIHLNAFISLLRKFSIISVKKHVARESTMIFSRFKGLRLKLYNTLYDIGYGGVDLVVCQTQLMRKSLLRNKPRLNAKKVIVVNNPITILDSSHVLINPLIDKQYIVAAGRLIPEKGFDVLIASFMLLRHTHKRLELVILGNGVMKESLMLQVRSLGLEQYIHLIGHVDDVYSYFKFSACCVVSSRIEGFPNVLLQMMMVNDAVVSTTCAGGIEKIEGLQVCPVNDENALASKINVALGSDNSPNRPLFDSFLKENNIESFIGNIEQNINLNEKPCTLDLNI